MDKEREQEMHVYRDEPLRQWGHLLPQHGQSFLTDTAGTTFSYFENFVLFLRNVGGLHMNTKL